MTTTSRDQGSVAKTTPRRVGGRVLEVVRHDPRTARFSAGDVVAFAAVDRNYTPAMPHAYIERDNSSFEAQLEERTASVDAAFLLPHLRSGMRVLDVGCGPGTISSDSLTRTTSSLIGIPPSALGLANTSE